MLRESVKGRNIITTVALQQGKGVVVFLTYMGVAMDPTSAALPTLQKCCKKIEKNSIEGRGFYPFNSALLPCEKLLLAEGPWGCEEGAHVGW